MNDREINTSGMAINAGWSESEKGKRETSRKKNETEEFVGISGRKFLNKVERDIHAPESTNKSSLPSFCPKCRHSLFTGHVSGRAHVVKLCRPTAGGPRALSPYTSARYQLRRIISTLLE